MISKIICVALLIYAGLGLALSDRGVRHSHCFRFAPIFEHFQSPWKIFPILPFSDKINFSFYPPKFLTTFLVIHSKCVTSLCFYTYITRTAAGEARVYTLMILVPGSLSAVYPFISLLYIGYSLKLITKYNIIRVLHVFTRSS